LVSVTAAFIGAPLAAILINNLLPRNPAKKICLNLNILVALLQMVAALACLWLIMASGRNYIDFSAFWDMNALPNAARFSVDTLSLVVLFSIGLVALVSLLSARQTIGDKALNFSNLLLVIMLGMNGIAMVNDLFSLYVFLEVTGIASFIMIALFRNKRGLEGAFKYLAMSALASAFLLASLAFIFMEAGSLRFVDVARTLGNWRATSQPLLLLISCVFFVAAFAIKAGLFPFHGWLPDAYQSAPPAVSVLLGGVVTKVAGVYAIIRVLYGVFAHAQSVHLVFGLLGIVSIFYGALAAVGQRDMKRILAYSSISQMGYIVLGAASGSLLGLIGATLHFFNHATFKSTLFVNAAALEKQAGGTDIELLPGGLQEQMPLTGISSMLAFFSTAGIPPLAGFWSKLLIIIAVWQAGYPSIAVAALLASLITAVYFLRLQRKIFFGNSPESAADIQEVKGSFAVAEALLSVITVAMGLLFPAILLVLRSQGLL